MFQTFPRLLNGSMVMEQMQPTLSIKRDLMNSKRLGCLSKNDTDSIQTSLCFMNNSKISKQTCSRRLEL